MFLVVRNWQGRLFYEKTTHAFSKTYQTSRVAKEYDRVRLSPEDEGRPLSELMALYNAGFLSREAISETPPVAWYWSILKIPPTTDPKIITQAYVSLAPMCGKNKLLQLAKAADAALTQCRSAQ